MKDVLPLSSQIDNLAKARAYDLYIVGSDQVWNPYITHGYKEEYFANQSGVKYVNSLITELNRMLSHTDGQNGFRVAVSNYSPYEVAVTVLSAVESVASIASLVWMTIDAVKKDKQKQKLELAPVDIDIYRRYMDTRIDLLRADLLRLQKECSARRFSKYIDEVTQQLKTDLEDLYTKDILLFKVKNNNSSK